MKALNGSGLIKSIAKKTGLSQAYAKRFTKAFLGTVTDALAKGKGVRLIGFGSFKVNHHKAYKSRKLQTNSKQAKI